MSFKMRLTELIVTFFYLGKIRYAPGTWGSLAAFPCAYIIIYFIMRHQIIFEFSGLNLKEAQLLTLVAALGMLSVVLLLFGLYFSHVYVSYYKVEDPKEIVIDEVVGQLLTVTLSYLSLVIAIYSDFSKYISHDTLYICFIFLMPFGLFRFFDIIKPWPIRWLDKNIKGAIGIMLDDIVAAIFASIMQYAITFVIIDWASKVG